MAKKGKKPKKTSTPADKADGDKASAKSNQKRPQRKTPFSGGQAVDLTWFLPGKEVRDFWADKRLTKKEITATFKGGMGAPQIELRFTVASPDGLGLEDKKLSASEYIEFKRERENSHKSSQEEDSWNSMIQKLSVRLGIGELTRPQLFGKAAKAIILDNLTPFERAVLNLSQKDWSKVDVNKLSDLHAKYGSANKDKRVAHINAKLSRKDSTAPDDPPIHTTPFRVKEVAVMLEKKTIPTPNEAQAKA